METHQTCLAEIEEILHELARRIGAEHSPGTGSEAESRFIASGADAKERHLAGRSGIRVSVLLERFEGYSFVSAHGTGDRFHRVCAFLYARYLEEGGNPDTQEPPVRETTRDEALTLRVRKALGLSRNPGGQRRPRARPDQPLPCPT